MFTGRRTLLMFFGFVILCLLICESAGNSSKSRPNVLLILVDDFRPALGCYGHKNILTPNIDQLASQSVRFEKAFVQQALCGPSRTSFLTSRRPDTTRLYDFYSYWRETVGNYTTLPQYFKENGYHSTSIGKIFHHGGNCSGKHQDYPYSWSEIPYIPSTYNNMKKPVCPGPDGKRYENLLCPVDVSKQPEGSLPDIQNADRALQFLKNHSTNADKPFFLGVGYYKPHVPFKFPKEYLDLYPLSSVDPAPDPHRPVGQPDVAWNPWTDIRERHDIAAYNLSFPYGPVPRHLELQIRQHYYASTSYMDYQVGRLLDGLDQYGLSDNTVIAFMGDHGWSMGEHQEWSKYSVYDISTRVPLMFWAPWFNKRPDPVETNKHFPLQNVLLSKDETLYFESKMLQNSGIKSQNHQNFDSKVSVELAEAVDLFPTLVDLAGLKSIPYCPIDTLHTILCTEGTSLAPLLPKSPFNINNSTQLPTANFRWKNASFSQYPRPGEHPTQQSDKPRLAQIRIMGYAMHTHEYHFVEWVAFSPGNFTTHWDQVHARELYEMSTDPLQDKNLASDKAYEKLVEKLAKDLRIGWRGALPIWK